MARRLRGVIGATAMTPAALCAAVALTAVCPARATTARDSRFQPNVEATVRYLQNSQKENGGFAEPGGEANPDFTAWTALALAAAGINPRDQATAKQHYLAGHSAYTYLADHAHQASLTTDFERELLVVDAAGTSSHDFGGVDLAGEILKRQLITGDNSGAFPHEAGSWTAGINDTIFAILSLSPIHEPAVEAAIGRAARWLEAQQKCDGSWNWTYTPRVRPCDPKARRPPEEEPGEVDMTGAALEALNAAKHPDSEGQEWAFEYLHEAETPNGGFPEQLGEREPNVASTAWVVQAMWSAGINPEAETWSTKSGLASDEPLGYLASMQQEDGHIRYQASEELNGMWMTSYATPAFTGNPLPIPEVPYTPLPALPPDEPAGASSGISQTTTADGGDGDGDGGVSTNRSGGVIAGGGGDGAPLFSRPQPASKGHTPGGARQLKSQKHEHRRTRRRNPGAARRHTVPTTNTANAGRIRVRRDRDTGSEGFGSARAGAGAGTIATSHARQAGAANHGQGPDAGRAGPGTGEGSGGGGVSLPAADAAQPHRAASGTEVKGVLIGGPRATDSNDQLEAGAPGLRSAGAGDREQWLTSATCVAIALLILAGALFEHRRPQTTL